MVHVIDDFEGCYRFMQSRDPRYDGFFFVGVTSTGVYCRPSCPARLPYRRNVRLFRAVAAAQHEGFRACKRCDPTRRPGRPPGTGAPEWRDARAADRGRGCRPRRRGRARRAPPLLRAAAGPDPHGRAGSRPGCARARPASAVRRTLIETTELPFAEVAVGAGFGSVRQFNDTLRAVYGRTPSELRARARRRRGAGRPGPSSCASRREPFDGESVPAFLAARAIRGVEEVEGLTYRRTLALEHGPALIALTPEPRMVRAELRLADLRDLTAVVARCRRLFDLDADPWRSPHSSARTRTLAPLVAARPGLRVPGCADGFELGVRAIVGQQVSVAAAPHVPRPPGRAVRRAAPPAPATRSRTASPLPRRWRRSTPASSPSRAAAARPSAASRGACRRASSTTWWGGHA